MNELSGLWNVPFWGAGVAFCSRCGKPAPFGLNSHRRGYEYCPNCGTKMYHEDEEVAISHVGYSDEQCGREK